MASHHSILALLLAAFTLISAASPILQARDDSSPSLDDPSAPWIAGHTSPEASARRTYFYVGGKYENATDGSGTIRTGQIYVEQLVPAQGPCQKYPVVFWAGAAQTGTNWLNTPDGRQGWGSYFLEQGYVIYLVDQPQRGRSPWELSQGSVTYFTVEQLESQFTAPEDFDLYPLSVFHTQWPGSGRQGDPVFDQFYASQVQYQANATLSESLNRDAGIALFKAIGPAILITHSQAGAYGWSIADAVPDLLAGVVAIEPQGPPFQNALVQGTGLARPYGITQIPLTYDPPAVSPTSLVHATFPSAGVNLTSCNRQAEPAKQLMNIAKVPVMLLSSQASYHSAYDYCTAAYLEQAGVSVDFVSLPGKGIQGNGHFLFLEKNNLEIAALVQRWLEGLTKQ